MAKVKYEHPDAVIAATQLRLEELDDAVKVLETEPDPVVRVKAYHRFVRDAREVTFVLQRLRGICGDEFNAWYKPYQEQMAADPLLRAIHEARNAVEKQGAVGPGSLSMKFGYLPLGQVNRYFLRPHNAVGFFVGDHLGRSGWKVRRPNGKIDRKYVDLPASWGVQVDFNFIDRPGTHLGQDISHLKLAQTLALARDYYRALVADADATFGGEDPDDE